MSFLKKLFSKPQQQRQLTKVAELRKGDIFILDDSFALPQLLRGQQFEVTGVNSYEYEHHTDTEWVLQGPASQQLYLSLYADDQTYLKLSIKLAHEDVETLFDLEQFANIFEQGECVIERQQDNDYTQGFSCPAYRQYTFAKVGFFHRKDHRSEHISEFSGKDQGERLELFQLEGNDDRYSIDIEVWDDGDTDVFLNLYRPLSDVKDMFPGS